MAEDDWRVTVTLRDASHTGRLRRALHEAEVEDEVRSRLGARVAVGEGDGVVFLYTSTRDAAEEAGRVAREVLPAYGMDAELRIDRWHPIEERWEGKDVPLPATETERRVEHERREEDEIAESENL